MTCKHLLNGSPDCVFCHRDQLKHELSLAEEGLANYAQENAQLRALLTQAPIAKVTVRESFGGDVLDWVMCAPGLPPGEHDLYLMPSVPQSAEHPSDDRCPHGLLKTYHCYRCSPRPE